ncbi:MAG: indole-3-glycerol phosphate synthase TrpC [Planctomycetaceae bacterium]
MGFLEGVVAQVRRRLAADPLDVERLRRAAAGAPAPRPWAAALRARPLAVIAEVKRASPSAGPIASPDPVAQALAYARGGAAAISVLTEPDHFHGSLQDLVAVRAGVDLPVLRKDFLVAPSQVVQARAAGADAVLVIASAVDDDELRALLEEAAAWGLGVLLETHGDDDLERALGTDAEVIGVNARDLETLAVDPAAARARLRAIPQDRVAVLESGIATRADVEAARRAGASAILVGEALMRAPDPSAMVRELLDPAPPSREEPSR